MTQTPNRRLSRTTSNRTPSLMHHEFHRSKTHLEVEANHFSVISQTTIPVARRKWRIRLPFSRTRVEPTPNLTAT